MPGKFGLYKIHEKPFSDSQVWPRDFLALSMDFTTWAVKPPWSLLTDCLCLIGVTLNLESLLTEECILIVTKRKLRNGERHQRTYISHKIVLFLQCICVLNLPIFTCTYTPRSPTLSALLLHQMNGLCFFLRLYVFWIMSLLTQPMAAYLQLSPLSSESSIFPFYCIFETSKQTFCSFCKTKK